MTRDDTTATIAQQLRPASEQTMETEADTTVLSEVSLNGESVDIDPDTTVGELRERAGIGSAEVFTHRSPDGIEALTDDDVVGDHIDEGDEIQTQPIADSEVFGAR